MVISWNKQDHLVAPTLWMGPVPLWGFIYSSTYSHLVKQKLRIYFFHVLLPCYSSIDCIHKIRMRDHKMHTNTHTVESKKQQTFPDKTEFLFSIHPRNIWKNRENFHEFCFVWYALRHKWIKYQLNFIYM